MYRSSRLFARETTPDKNNGPQQEKNDTADMMRLIFGDAVPHGSNNAENDDSPELSSTEKRKARVKDDTDKVVEHLQKRHGIITPKGFAQTLSEEREVHFSSSPNSVPLRTIDAIVEACSLWKPYITPESFHNLVCEQVKSMFRLRASAICYTNSGAELKAYIGHFATLTQKPPLGFSCSVNYYGKVMVNGV